MVLYFSTDFSTSIDDRKALPAVVVSPTQTSAPSSTSSGGGGGQPLRSFYLRQQNRSKKFKPLPPVSLQRTGEETVVATPMYKTSARIAKLKDFPRETPSNDPRFVTYNNTVVESQVGATAILHCKTSSSTGGLVSGVFIFHSIFQRINQ